MQPSRAARSGRANVRNRNDPQASPEPSNARSLLPRVHPLPGPKGQNPRAEPAKRVPACTRRSKCLALGTSTNARCPADLPDPCTRDVPRLCSAGNASLVIEADPCVDPSVHQEQLPRWRVAATAPPERASADPVAFRASYPCARAGQPIRRRAPWAPGLAP